MQIFVSVVSIAALLLFTLVALLGFVIVVRDMIEQIRRKTEKIRQRALEKGDEKG